MPPGCVAASSLGQEAQLVFGGEGAALGIGDDLGTWARRRGRDGFARRSTAVVLAPLDLPTFRGGQSRRGSRRDSIVLHIDSDSRPTQ